MIPAEELLVFNGIDADTGEYLTPPTSLADLAGGIRGERPDGSHLTELQRRRRDDEDHLGVIYGRDPGDPGSAGWGLVVSRDVDPAVLEALEPLVGLRREQAGGLYKQLEVETGEDKGHFLRRYGMGPGPADPRKVPYYLLIVGTPEQIPFSFQYQLDVSYAVGRLDFDTAGEYASYADAVVTAEAPATPSAGQGVHLFGVRNPGDTPTALSAARLVEPLAAELRQTSAGWTVTDDVGAPATKQRLYDLLMGESTAWVLFTASHGVGTSGDQQRETQGALLCQDWPGPLKQGGQVSAEHYLAGDDIPVDRAVGPRVIFAFACYGGGTPRVADFPTASGGPRPVLAEESFVARLPQRLLGNPAGGALAFVGHVDRAWSCSFLWQGTDAQIAAFTSTMLALLDGVRLGHAMEAMNSRYAELSTELTSRIDEFRKSGKLIKDSDLVGLWTANNDARSYVVLGDPAVRVITPTPTR
jgi:hypothetical protein